MEQLPSLERLVRHLQRVPYLAGKNVHRVAHYFLQMSSAELEQFCTVLQHTHQHIIKCPICCAWQEVGDTCHFCKSSRDHTTICVVETWHDLSALERTGGYQGQYHVLGGVICPLDGIGPDDLSINVLLNRITPTCKEIIVALNQTPEGQATAAYLVRKIKALALEPLPMITCLSRGVPVGVLLETIDRITVSKALAERRLF